ncbi:MAG: glycosyltransferase [Bacteroidota bacterium]
MKILLTSIGTRGDMEPFLAIGEILKAKGHHDITCLFPEQFRKLAEDSGFQFASMGSEFLDMLESPAGMIAMGGGGLSFEKIKAYWKLISIQRPISRAMIRTQQEVIEGDPPDLIVHNGKVIYPVIWSLKHKGKTTLVSPVPYMHYVKDQAHVAFNKDYGPFLNKLTYKLTNYGLVKTIMNSVRSLPGLERYRQQQVQTALFTNKTVYTISPTLFARPDYWSPNFQVLGYHERNKIVNWQPSPELEAFLQKHPKLLFITFGSMINRDPVQKTKIVVDILERNQLPAIINTASGGLVEPASCDRELIHFVPRIPYDWIFPKIHAVVHHGGSGTTHTALKYGCASMIIPHIIDQYVWNKMLFRKGAGPLGVDVDRIRTANLEPKMLDLFQNDSYKRTAEALGEKIKAEDFQNELYDFIIN